MSEEKLRVAIVTASLGVAGAEKQAFYIARALAEAGIAVRVYNLGRGGEYADALHSLGVQSRCFGWLPTVPLRLLLLIFAMRSFRPNVIQSVHAYTNIYSALAARIFGAISVGGLRSDVASYLMDSGRFARPLLRWPDAIAANSNSACSDLKRSGLVNPRRVHLLPNAIDLDAYSTQRSSNDCTAIYVGRLMPAKRVDVFLRALAKARRVQPAIKGIVAGYGTETAALERLAVELALSPDSVTFLGFREDISSLMEQASMFVFCSESEGTPNVILEAMAAALPIVTTPAGDAAEMVESAGAGVVVPFGDVDATAAAILRLAHSPELRRRLGNSGRTFVAQTRATSELAPQLIEIYREVANTCVQGRRGDFVRRMPQLSERL
jgi:glycosyltransferase involved in cell wall biosynthesis